VNVLLLIGKSSTSQEAVAAEAEELRRQGHRVTVGTRVPPRPVLADAVDEVVRLSPSLPAPPPALAAPPVPAVPTVPAATADVAAADAVSPAGAPASAGPRPPARGVVGSARRRVRQLRAQVSGAVTEPARSWRAVRRNATVMRLARDADVIVAVDAPMVRAVWHLGRQLPLPAGPEVVYGLPAAATAIARRAATPH
jgi:hypothetical protein